MAEARAAGPETAAAKLREALALWRGPALADLAYESFAQVEIARLEEMRLTVLEQRIDADLALGRHAELVGELEALVARFPLREPLRGQLMLALYRSGRQAEALDAYRAARRELAEELGLEPSEELQRLEQAILRHEPALAAAARSGAWLGATAAPQPIVLEPCVARSADRGSPASTRCSPSPSRLPPRSQPGRELIVAGVVPAAELAGATAVARGSPRPAPRRGPRRAHGRLLLAEQRRGHRTPRLPGERRSAAAGCRSRAARRRRRRGPRAGALRRGPARGGGRARSALAR